MAKLSSVNGCVRLLPSSNMQLTEPSELKHILQIISYENCEKNIITIVNFFLLRNT